MNITAYPLRLTNDENTGIFFSCSRTGKRTAEMKKLYHDIVSEAAHSHLTEQALCLVSPNSCSPNKRGDLHECGCRMLDSNTTHGNAARVRYRDNILAIARQLVEQDPNEPFKIGFFASGGLYGEVSMILRLAEALKKRGIHRELRCFFVDPCYEQGIKNSRRAPDLETVVGRQKPILQFFKELTHWLPKSITVQGVFFKSIQDYQAQAQGDPWFKHDLFTGADTERYSHLLENVKTLAGSSRAVNPIVLLKGEEPLICTIEGDNHECSGQKCPSMTIANEFLKNPAEYLKKHNIQNITCNANPPSPAENKESDGIAKKESHFWTIVLVVVLIVVALAVGIVAWKVFSNRAKFRESIF